jgi:eukaryotic-like serine/threonine-protein kinase
MGQGPGDPIDAALTRASARRKLFGAGDAPPRIGRYVIERRIGSGTMGVVYAAHDPQLDRKVAIKLLHASGEGDAVASRLEREAQTLARLRHPNVVAAYDLGTWQGQVFLAMEHVEGTTLRAWLVARPRSWRAVVEIFVAAARGLAAAHRAGIVHRDFKPDNVLVGVDGDVRVVDFGLARSGAVAGETPGFAGTPAYAAPECLDGRAADARADQYSFFVSLHEALFGARPASDGAPPPSRGLPSRVRRILTRGLAADPAARFPSMDDVVAALVRDPAASLRRAGAAAVLAAIAVVATYGLTRGGSRPATDPCAGAAARLSGVWDDEARARVAQGFRATGVPFAEEAYGLVAAGLDAYTSQWVAAHTDACRATQITGEQSAELFDTRMACLSAHLRTVDELVDKLARPDADLVRRAGEVVHQLPYLPACADLRALRERVPPPTDPKTAAAVEALRGRYARAEAAWLAGDLPEGERLAREIVEEARVLGYAPIRAETLRLLAKLQRYDPDRAERSWEELGVAAAEAHDDRLVAEAWIQRLLVVGYGKGEFEAALRMRSFAEAAVARTGHDPVLEATLLNAVGIIRDETGYHQEAQDLFRQALALRERAFGPEDPEVAKVLGNLGDSYRLSGDYAAALAVLERSRAIFEKALGRHHPVVAGSEQNLGAVFLELGDLPRARELTERALERYRRINEQDPPVPLSTLGWILFLEGRRDEGLAILERANDDMQRRSPGDIAAGSVELNLGMALRGVGRRDQALAHLRHAAASYEKALGPSHAYLAEALVEVGLTLEQGRDRREALPLFERAVAIYEATGDPRRRGAARFALARALPAAQAARARALAESALADFTAAGAPAAADRQAVTTWLAR